MKWFGSVLLATGIVVAAWALALPEHWIYDGITAARDFTAAKQHFLFLWLGGLTLIATILRITPARYQWSFLVVVGFFMLLIPPLGSGDVFSAVARSQSVSLGENPFVVTPHGPIAEGWLPGTWLPFSTPYGPLWHYLPDSLFAMTGSVSGAVWFLRLVCLLTAAATVVVVRLLGSGRWLKQFLPLAPLFLFEVVNNAHPEGFMVLLLLIALLAIRDQRFWLATLAVIVATAVKPVALIALLVVWWCAGRHWWKQAILAGVVGAGLIFPFVLSGGVLTGLRQFGQIVYWNGLSPLIATAWLLPQMLQQQVVMTYPEAMIVAVSRTVGVAAWALATFFTLLHSKNPTSRLFLPFLWMLLFVPAFVQPWYLVWIMPLVWLVSERWAGSLGFALVIAWLVSYGTLLSTLGLLLGGLTFLVLQLSSQIPIRRAHR